MDGDCSIITRKLIMEGFGCYGREAWMLICLMLWIKALLARFIWILIISFLVLFMVAMMALKEEDYGII